MLYTMCLVNAKWKHTETTNLRQGITGLVKIIIFSPGQKSSDFHLTV